MTLAELLVGMVITVILGIAVVSIYRMATNEGRAMPDRSAQWNAMTDASQQLVRDIGQGTTIEYADAQRLVVLGQYGQADITDADQLECVRRDYRIEGATVTVRTAWLGSPRCAPTGAEEERVETLLEHFTGDATFRYLNEAGREKAVPVTDLAGIKVVEWHLATQIPGLTAEQVLDSAQAFSGRPVAMGSGIASDEDEALAPLLTITTPVVGRDRPVLSWTDGSPTITTGWTVWRASWVTGTSAAGKLTQVGYVSNPATLTWTDPDLADGASAQYVVTATLRDGRVGPQSNAVITGMRPARATGLTAVGSGQKVTVSWNRPSGATSFDVYRNGSAIATGVTGTTYTATIGYGQNDLWTVGSQNGWGQLWMTGLRGQDISLGAAMTQQYKGTTRPLPTHVAAWTAPPAPTLVASPNSNGSNDIAVTFAAWSKPANSAATTLNRGWELQGHETGQPYADLWATERAATDRTYTHGGRTLGDSTQYRARVCNSAGCGPWSGADSALQRPPAPLACTAVLDADTPTRTVSVTVNPRTMQSTATGYGVAGGTPVDGSSVSWSGAETAKTKTADRLEHGTVQAFTSKVRNASGWSDTTACSVKTQTVALSLTARAEWVGSVAQVTRTVSAQVKSSNATVITPTLARNDGSTPLTGEDQGNGMKCSSSSTTHCTASDTWYWDPLQDDRTYRIRARATDGVNNTTDTLTVSTRELDAPVITVGTVTTRSIAVSFTATEGLTTEAGFKLNGNLVAEPGHRWYTYDPLSDATAYTVTAVNSDGYNEALSPRGVTTKSLTVPAAATCVATLTDAVAPGAITVGGGDQVRLGSSGSAYDGPRSYTGLDAGTYQGWARNISSDGHNVALGVWDACPTRTVTAPFTPSIWDKAAPECPMLAIYIPATAPQTWQIRRATESRCDLRWIITTYGVGIEHDLGDVVATGQYAVGSGAAAYTPVTGTGPWGPLTW